ncbi:helix-turn-helix domain-containing protein [Dokdonia donghaensis]|nr:helix-turn-helix domain-containing protein [Dokdonia donghaensis]ANH60865.1 Helix-turn-helix domain protein [Dokdonia donghaensis DSW-1]
MMNTVTQLHSTTPEKFKAELLQGVTECLNQFSEQQKATEPVEWLSRKDLKVMLQVSLVTIHDWCKKGILKPYKIGRMVRFKRSEVVRILEESATK